MAHVSAISAVFFSIHSCFWRLRVTVARSRVQCFESVNVGTRKSQRDRWIFQFKMFPDRRRESKGLNCIRILYIYKIHIRAHSRLVPRGSRSIALIMQFRRRSDIPSMAVIRKKIFSASLPASVAFGALGSHNIRKLPVLPFLPSGYRRFPGLRAALWKIYCHSR